jgi:hypothetical protein
MPNEVTLQLSPSLLLLANLLLFHANAAVFAQSVRAFAMLAPPRPKTLHLMGVVHY